MDPCGDVSHPPPPEPPALDDQDVIEAHELTRRRTLAAFLWGSQSGVRSRDTEAVRGLLLGAAVAIAIALVAGIVALVEATRAAG